MRNSTFWLVTALGGVLAGLAGAALLTLLTGDQVPWAIAGLAGWLVFAWAPWLAIPAGILAPAGVALMVRDADTRLILAIHGAVLALALLGLLTKRIARHSTDPIADRVTAETTGGRLAVPGRKAMVVVGVLVVVGVVYGLARGHRPYDVMADSAPLAAIPAYFVLAIHTVNSPRRRRYAALALLVGALALSALRLFTPAAVRDGYVDWHVGMLLAIVLVALVTPPGSTASVGSRAGPFLGLPALVLPALVLPALALAAFLMGGWSIAIIAGLAIAVLMVRGTTRVRRRVALAVGAALLLGVAGSAAVSATAVSTTGSTPSGSTASSGTPGIAALAGRLTPRMAAPDPALDTRGTAVSAALERFADSPLIGTGPGQEAPVTPGLGPTGDVPPSGGQFVASVDAFWVGILADLGVLGLVVLLVPMVLAIATGLGYRDGPALGFAALLAGAVVGGFLPGPAYGGSVLGVLPALIWLCALAPATTRPPTTGGTDRRIVERTVSCTS